MSCLIISNLYCIHLITYKHGKHPFSLQQALNGSETAEQANLKPKLLSGKYKYAMNGSYETVEIIFEFRFIGELEVARARNVMLYTPTSKLKDDNGIPGLLVVTNFKLSFLSIDDVSTINRRHKQNN